MCINHGVQTGGKMGGKFVLTTMNFRAAAAAGLCDKRIKVKDAVAQLRATLADFKVYPL